jgi:hypothetical protein
MSVDTDVPEIELTDELETNMAKDGPNGRGPLVNVGLILLAVAGAALFLVLYLMYFIIDLNLLGDPEAVWSHAMMFAPQLGLVVLLFQSVIFRMENNPLKAPTVWGIVVGLVAIVFNVVASFFYFRLFWKCVTNIGSFEPLEQDMCDYQKTALYTIAWFNFVFCFHALISVVLLAWAYTSDVGKIDSLKRKISGGLRTALRKVRSNDGTLNLSLMKIHNEDDKFVAGLIGNMVPSYGDTIKKNEHATYRRDARSSTPVRQRQGSRVTRSPYGAV